MLSDKMEFLYPRLRDYLVARNIAPLHGIVPVFRTEDSLSNEYRINDKYVPILSETPRPDPKKMVNPLRVHICSEELHKVGEPVTVNQENHLDDPCEAEIPCFS